MPVDVYLAAFGVMVGLALAVYALIGDSALASMSAGRRRPMPSRPATLRDLRLQTKATDRILGPMMGALVGKARRFTPIGAIEEMEHKITVAGASATWTVERLIATKLAMGVTGFAAGGYFVYTSPGLRNLVIAFVITAGCYVLPDMSLDRRGKDRSKLIEKELPDILDQLTIGVEAGLGFDAALMRVSQENQGPVAEEFGRMMQDRQLGMSREESFSKIIQRSSSPDLRHFIMALNQADKHGMPLATVLRVQADEMRQKRKVRAEEKALSLPVKMVLPLVLCILPALFTVILGPAAFRLTKGGLAG
jgi:tight adherence protein C